MRQLYGIGTSVFVQKEDEILILKRAMGEAVGSWYLPGGAIEAGESTETGARRELVEETGLAIKREFHLVAITPMYAYGQDMFSVSYACDYERGVKPLAHNGYKVPLLKNLVKRSIRGASPGA